jgi:hypothetical protein
VITLETLAYKQNTVQLMGFIWTLYQNQIKE